MVSLQDSLLNTSSRPDIDSSRSTLSRTTNSQGLLPPEIWIWIIQQLDDVDLFSLYNTSATLRVLIAPFLVQVIASKSVILFFYQEYVCRTGITFVFDHFDMTRDLVVFKPQSTHHTIAFRNGITIQRPQLEEILVRSRDSRFQGGQVLCSEEGIYSIRWEDQESPPRETQVSSSSGCARTVSFKANNSKYHGIRIQYPENRFSMLNYLDRACALSVKRTGCQLLSGKKHSFGHNYPWALHYVTGDRPCGVDLPYDVTNGSDSASQFTFDASDDVSSQISRNNSSVVDKRNMQSRYLQTSRFECSINFLDPRRASRSLFRRWIEGKMSQFWQMIRARQMTVALTKRRLYHNNANSCKAHEVSKESIKSETNDRRVRSTEEE